MTTVKEFGNPIPKPRFRQHSAFLRNQLVQLKTPQECLVEENILVTDLTKQQVSQVIHHFSKKNGKRFTTKTTPRGIMIWRTDDGKNVIPLPAGRFMVGNTVNVIRDHQQEP